MILFALFLSIVTGLLLVKESYFFIGIILFLLLCFLLYKIKNKKIIGISTVLLLISLIFSAIPFQSFQTNDISGMVIERKDSYFILFDGIEKFYVCSDDEEIKKFDIVKLKGEITNYNFNILESDFNFNIYLEEKGIYRQIIASSFETIWDCPIDFNYYKENLLLKFEDEQVRVFVSSLLFNQRDYDNKLIQKFESLKICNLIAVSGAMITFALYGIKKLFSYFVDEKYASWFALLTLFPYLLFFLGNYTVLRVLIFYILNLINKNYLDNRFERIEIIAIAGILSLIIDHNIIFSSSFYIPFIIITILNFCNLFLSRKKNIEKKIYGKVFVLLILFPFTISFYNSFNILSFIIGIIFLPIFKLNFIILLFVFLGYYHSSLESFIKFQLDFFNHIQVDALDVYVPSFNQFFIVLYFVIFLLLIYFLEVSNKKAFKLVSYSLITSIVIYSLPIENYLFNQISFLNVGQGDCTFIRYFGETYLIDTGGLTYKDLAKDVLINYFKINRIYQIDYVIITHSDFDHNGALSSLIENFKVSKVFTYNNFNNYYDGNLEIKDLNLFREISMDENDKSIVPYFKINNVNYLLMGDASILIEEKIINNYSIDVDILKVGHHGSSTSSSKKFLDFCSPETAIISCGRNNYYGHPSDIVIQRLKSKNIDIRRTDLEGTITYKYFILSV